MLQTTETRRVGNATGLGKSSLFCRCDNPENRPFNHPIQATNKPADARRVRLQYLARRLHGLGEKPLFHFLDEVERGEPLRPHLERYAALPAEFIKAHSGDKFQSLAQRNAPDAGGAP
jgi:hypothetical protein